MTITPKQASELTEDEKSVISGLEKSIDALLLRDFGNSYGNRAVYSINNNRREDVTERVMKEITRMYDNAGWNVKSNYSQFDGEWIEFTPKGDSE